MCWCFNHSKNIVLTTISDKKIPVENELLRIHNRYYYPFGSPMDGRTFSSEKYRFGFNTQEKVDEVYGKGNLNTALFWEYDTRLGRRWNLDPKPQINISDYAVMGNNPIANIDWLGDEWDESNNSKEKADKFRENANNERTKLLEVKSSIKNNLNKDNKEYNEQLKQIENIEARVKEIDDALFEIDELEKSTQVHRLQPRIEMPGTTTYTKKDGHFYEKKNDGETYYKNGVVVMEYNLGDLSMQAHELKHGYQFEKGLVSFNRLTGKSGWLYDLTDEKEAYKRGSAFDVDRTKPLLNLSNDDLINMGYFLIDVPLNSSMSVYDVFSSYKQVRVPKNYFEVQNFLFKNAGIDFVK